MDQQQLINSIKNLNEVVKNKFPTIEFRQVLDRQSQEEFEEFFDEIMAPIADIVQKLNVEEKLSLVKLMAEYAPDVYARSKADCYIDALDNKGSVIGVHAFEYVPGSEFKNKIKMFSGEELVLSSKSSAEETGVYWQKVKQTCGGIFDKPSSLDSDIEEFVSHYPERLEKFLVEYNSNSHSEL